MSLLTAIQSAFESQTVALGFWLTLPSSAVARTILRATSTDKSRGISWVLIDAEHGLITDKDYYELTTAIASEGASPFIRVPWAEEWMIKRALDAGAHGIVLPMCHSADDAKKIVQYCKYPPIGSRGYGPLFTIHSFPGTEDSNEYVAASEKGLTVVVQIETKAGLENVEDIAAVQGIDVLFIGPFDLAMQNGMTRGGDAHEAAIQRILQAAHSAGKRAAIYCTDGNDARKRFEEGFDMVSINTDIGVLGSGMVGEMETTRGLRTGNASSAKGGY